MPGIGRLRNLAVVATLPETRRLVLRGARPATLRALAARARTDRAELLREAARHPVAAELANAGMLLLPLRYSPIGWIGGWAIRRIGRRAGRGTGSSVGGDVARGSARSVREHPGRRVSG